MPESLYGAHPKKLPVRFKLPSHLDLLRFQHAKVKVGSPDHIQENRPRDSTKLVALKQEIAKEKATR